MSQMFLHRRVGFLHSMRVIGAALLVAGVVLFAAEQVCTAQTAPAEGTPVASGQDDPQDVLKGTLLAQRAFRLAADRVLPSLVTIESFGGVTAVQGRIGGIRSQGEGNSTGVLISTDGYIVTSTFNFIQQPPVITVVTSDGKQRIAKLVGRDDTRRICLLKVDGPVDLPIPEMMPVDEAQVGQWAISVGVGYGDKNPAISMGIISAKKRVGGRAIQTDANVSPANYGGALLDIEGRMIGVCVPLSPNSQAAGSGVEWYDSGIGFAIPLHGAEKILEKMKAGESIRPGFLGIQMVPENEDGSGVKIESVQDDSPASASGLEAGDLIVSVDGEPVQDIAQLRTKVGGYIEGDTIKITYRRGDEETEIEVTLAARPEGQ